MQHSFPHTYILRRKYRRDKRKIKYTAHFNLKMTTVVLLPHPVLPPLNRFSYFSNRLFRMKIKGKQTLLNTKGQLLTFHQHRTRHSIPTPKESNFLVTQVSPWQTNHALPSRLHCWLQCKSHLQPLLALSANFQKCWGPISIIWFRWLF